MRLVAFERVHLVNSITFVTRKRHGISRGFRFCYDWGVRMCDLCKDIAMNNDEYMEKRYAGGDFIFKDENGFGALIDTGDSGCLGYIKINYCPICGRKLVK